MLNLLQSFILLSLIFFSIFIITYLYTNNNYPQHSSKKVLLRNYMGLIFIIFGILKLYDLNKFVDIFSKYDIISNKYKIYSYFYPFIEIIIGILFLKNVKINITIFITILLMLISIISVLLSLFKGLNLRCGCLGSFFHIPLSYITLSENIIMLIMSIKYIL